MTSKLSPLFHRVTIRNPARAEGRFIQERKGVGLYAHVVIEIHPLRASAGVTVGWNAGFAIPAQFVPAVSDGIRKVIKGSATEGLELMNVHVSVEDGSYHDVDSTAKAFEEAAQSAVSEAIHSAGTVVLEALSEVRISVPDNLVKAVVATVSSHGEAIKFQSPESPATILATEMPSGNVDSFIEHVLLATEGFGRIVILDSGFRAKPEPPELLEPWVT